MYRELLVSCMHDLAEVGGNLAKANFGQVIATKKRDGTPVTLSDVAVNDLVISHFVEHYPEEVRVIGEEGNGGPEGVEYEVLLDSIDGTFAYAAGVPTYAIAMTLFHKRVPVAAIIHDPVTPRTWTAEEGKGVFVSNSNRDRQLKLGNGPVSLRDQNVAMAIWRDCGYELRAVEETLRDGSGAEVWTKLPIALAGGLIAEGDFVATVFPGKTAFETAAMALIVEEAGGYVTDLFGNSIIYNWSSGIPTIKHGHVMSASGHVQDTVLRIIQEANM